MKMKSTMRNGFAGLALALGLAWLALPLPASDAGVLATWNFYGSNSTQWQAAAPINGANLDSHISAATLTFGSAFTSTTSASGLRGNGTTWGGTGRTIATTDNSYVQLNFTAASGYTLTVSDLSCIMAGSTTGQGGQDRWAASVNGGAYSFVISQAAYGSNGTKAYDITDTTAGTNLSLRYYASPTAAAGSWGFLSTSTANHGITANGSTVASVVVPTLTSPTATAIDMTSATLGANITADGGGSITERGTVYGTSAAPTGNGAAEGGTATGVFTQNRSSLSQGTHYYYRGYAVNSAGTGYSPDGSFYTEPGQATNMSFSNVGGTGMRISWNADVGSSPDGFIVVMRATNSAVADPTDGVLHSASAAFGSGADLGDGSFVVYRDSGTYVDVTGLSAATTYYVEIFSYKGTTADSGVNQGINYHQANPSALSQATADVAPARWTALYNRGTPVYSYYLGDLLAYQFEFAINTDTTGWTVEYGLGTTGNGSGWTWRNADYSRNDGNAVWISKQNEQRFTSTGSWYFAGRFTTGSYVYNVAADWLVNQGEALSATNYFTVSALTAPSGVTAAKDGTYSATRVDLGWTQWNSKNVLITYATATPSGSPAQGTAYSAGNTFGNQTVVSGSQGGTSLEATGLLPGQTYYFTFYSENSSYYSDGATAAAVTMAMPQARNTGGGAPEAPATIFLGDTGKTFGFDSWGAIEANYGAARLWLRYNNADLTGGTASEWSSFVNDENKTRSSGAFTQTGTWYWGLQMDYGAEYGTAFWYKSASTDWADLSTSGAGASLTVTVSAINDPSSQTATRSASLPKSEIDLAWAKNNENHNVMVVRKLSTSSWTEPTQGTSYSAGASIGAGTVVYNGAGTSATAGSLAEGTTYDFKFYSVNNDYYSAGVTAQASTRACAPDAPTGLYANPTNFTEFTANWAAADGATGYRIDVSTNAAFSVAGSGGSIYTADFEDSVKSAYAPGTTTNHGVVWYFNDAVVGSTASDRKNGSYSARIRSNETVNSSGIISMNADTNMGLSSITLQYAVYGTDGASTGRVEYSTTSGSSWISAGTFVANSTTFQQFTATNINVSGNVRVRVVKTSGAGSNRMNVDDIALYPYAPATPSFVPGFENLAVAGTSASVTGLTLNTTYYFRVRAEGEGGCPSANSATASATTLAKIMATVELFNLNAVYDGSPKAVMVSTDPEGLAVDVTYNGSGTAPTAAGEYAVVATVVDDLYQGTAEDTLTIAKADQTIDFANPGTQWSTSHVGLAATASSGLPVGFAVLSGPATITGDTNLSFTGAGEVSIVASQTGDGNWNAAPAVTNTFTVSQKIATEVTLSSVNVREAGEGRFFVRLNQDPGADVMVTVARSSGDASIAVANGSVRYFKSSNWSAWQVVTLTAPDDGNTDSETATFQVSLAGADDRFVTAATLDDDIGENVALAASGTLISSSYPFSRPEQMIDGLHTASTNYGYTVCTSVPPGTITLDLRSLTTVARIRLLNWDWVQRVFRYQIESSTDGTNWTTLVDASAADHQGWDDWPVADVAVKYLRFTGLASTDDRSAVSIAEFEVYGTRDLSDLPQLVVSTNNVNVREGGEGRFFVRLDKAPVGTMVINVARSAGDAGITVANGATRTFTALNWNGWQAVGLAAAGDANGVSETATIRVSSAGVADQFVTAATLDDDIGENYALATAGTTVSGTTGSRQLPQLIDGVYNVSTNYGYVVWTNSPHGAFTVDLKLVTRVSRIRLLNWDWVYRVHRYTIESSLDGASWTTVADASASDRQGWDDWTVADQSARYLRVTGISNSANAYVVFSELEVYGSRAPLPQLEVSSASVNVREDGQGRFFVRLASAPTGNVTVAVSRSAGDASITVSGGASRSFTALNWNSWQAVTLAQAADGNADSESATIQMTAAGYDPAFVAAATLDDDIAENVALASGGATIAGWKAGLVAQAIDGIHAASANYGYTIWTNVPPGTMTLDMGAAMTVARVRLLNWNWNYRVQRYQIEASTDGASWTTLVDASASDRQGWDDWPVANQAIRYLRFTGLSNSANSTVVVSELEVYGTRPPARRALSVSAESEPVSVVTSDDVAPKFESGWAAVDGDPETAWVGQQAGGGNIVVEYGPTLELSGLAVDLAEGSLANVQYLYSLDAQNWQPLPEDLEANPVSLNFLWLLFSGDGTEAVPQVIEIRPNP